MRKYANYMILLVLMLGISFSLGENQSSSDMRLAAIPSVSGWNDEPAGTLIERNSDGIFCTYLSFWEDFLYYYNSTVGNGSIWKVDLHTTPYTPILVKADVGVVKDLVACSVLGSDGDELYLLTQEYDNAIMKINTTVLAYEKVVSLGGFGSNPSKLATFKTDDTTYFAWINSKVYFCYWNSSEGVIHEKFVYYEVGDLQIDCGPDNNPILFYYAAGNFYFLNLVTTMLMTYSAGSPITGAYFDLSRGGVYYFISNTLYKYDYFHETWMWLMDLYDGSSPHTLVSPCFTVWYSQTSGSYLYFLSIRPDDINTICRVIPENKEISFSNVSKILPGYSPFGNRSKLLSMYWGPLVYWTYNASAICVVDEMSDYAEPSQVQWAQEDQKITQGEWNLTWEKAWDLNGIDAYEIEISLSPSLTAISRIRIDGDETRYEEAGRSENIYLCKIRAIDSCGNVGEWGPGLKITYDEEPPLDMMSILLGLAIGGAAAGILAFFIMRRPKGS